MSDAPQPPQPQDPEQADVVVVGAGLAGLTAALRLRQGGRSVIVLEARERVGGRLLAAEIGDGEIVEVGGQWVGPTQERVLALLDELGIGRFPTFDEGRSVLELEGRLRHYSGTIPRVGPLVLADIAFARLRLQRLAARVEPGRPWASDGAAELDSRSLWDWLQTGMRTRKARTMMRVAGRTIWGPSRRRSRSCTRSSTCARPAASMPCSTSKAAPSSGGSRAARSGWRRRSPSSSGRRCASKRRWPRSR